MTDSIHIAESMRCDIGLGLNNLIAKGLYECVQDTPSRASTKEQTAQRSLPADEPKYRIWPSSRNHSVGTISEYDRIAALVAGRSSSATGFRSDKVSRMMLLDPPKPRSTQPIQTRRRAPVQDLKTMTTVQEGCMDSPTLPRQPQIRPTPRQSMRDRSVSEPCDSIEIAKPAPTTTTTKEAIKIKVKADLTTLPATVYSATDDCQPPSYERVQRESRITSFLAPLVIPDFGGLSDDFMLLGPQSFLQDTDIPPPVPPKSPKMNRSATPPNKFNTSHTNTSSATLVNSSRSPTPNTPQDSKTSPAWERTRKRPDDSRRISVCQTKSKAVIPRRTPSGYRQREQLGVRNSTLIQRHDISVVQETLLDDASPMEALSGADIIALSKELRDLEESCDHLRRTHNSLRASRRTLRSRMITYLKSPRVSAFKRKNILRREEALAELEVSIDDIVHKLEQAEARRTRIRQKLLQYASTSISQRKPSIITIGGRHTPPQSPGSPHQRGLRKKMEPTDSAESSYDATIESLLSDIERMILPPVPA
ncbi:MAG: hypothetical protein M1814_005250 [Vezdaea aestivalis]|nr:MAG: hypothetical protein M1814_005250 [Vezdaea aestivalis]